MPEPSEKRLDSDNPNHSWGRAVGDAAISLLHGGSCITGGSSSGIGNRTGYQLRRDY